MPSTVTTLLCLETLSKPIIWAKPSFMVPKGNSVTIWCQGTHEAVEYRLHFRGSLSAFEKPKPPRPMNKVQFRIPAMTLRTAGQYCCFYQSGELWSESSDLLDLVVTGTATSLFFLLKEGRASHIEHRHGNTQAEFSVGPVTTAHQGTYKCFSSYNNYVWSLPSEPVELLVTGDVGNTTLAPTDPTTSDSWEPYLLTPKTGFRGGYAFWDHTTQNLLRIGLSFLVLVALVCFLGEDWLSRKRTREGANSFTSEVQGKAENTTLKNDPRASVATGCHSK
ncbi:natural cytotoxicity triggering receptor 1 isoform X2 [Lemur catta]|uniref:natural cytotoxicity triggering receptor 1 isoform X2 n=1 Tax=Lemur catta TaxID=9447 RepID=UPI001E26A6E6|nr:natural cytotoxicity triggering receptor 1 isoform X2 [Lemur catta]